MKRMLIADVETTGIDASARVVELAWIEVDPDLNIIDRRYSLIDPEIPIPASASGVHGITNQDVCQQPTLAEFFDIVLPGEGWNPAGEFLLIAHNVRFDRRFIKPVMNVTGELCTLRLARRVWPDLENHKLATLMFALDLCKGQKHSAEGDVDTCHDLLRKIVETVEVPIAELADLSTQPMIVEKMPFGKHKGMPLGQLPAGYVTWLLGLDNLDEDMRHSLQRIYG